MICECEIVFNSLLKVYFILYKVSESMMRKQNKSFKEKYTQLIRPNLFYQYSKEISWES